MNVTVTFKSPARRRLAIAFLIALVFLTGLCVGSNSAHSADAKGCSRINYTQAEYKSDLAKYGKSVADYNEGFATATTECPR
jgi:hypothetical protein